MHNIAQINIRMDDDLKNHAEMLFNESGWNMSTAVGMFVKQAIRHGGIPFEVSTKPDPFYSEANMKLLRKTISEAEEEN